MLYKSMKYVIMIAAFTFLARVGMAQNRERVADLKGEWKFSIGDDMKWMNSDYNDADWDMIRVPSTWEDEGYHGYDGYAWYRKKVYIPQRFLSRHLDLVMGRIDDVDEVYFNGKLIGKTGSFPPDYITAYSVFRNYLIPNTIVKYNDWNIIAVRVYDDELSGGMLEGDFGIYAAQEILFPMMSLESEWKFKTGDSKDWKDVDYDDSNWKYLMVPGKWENLLGYPEYDGYAWYRKKFVPLNTLKGNKLVLMLGKIDDYDEVFINGVKIGQTGNVNHPRVRMDEQSYKQFRGYFVPDGLLKFDEENVIAVRVFDGFRDGGIYEGPVGFTTQQKYVEFWRKFNRGQKNFLEKMLFGED